MINKLTTIGNVVNKHIKTCMRPSRYRGRLCTVGASGTALGHNSRYVSKLMLVNNGLFHLIVVHPLWMSSDQHEEILTPGRN